MTCLAAGSLSALRPLHKIGTSRNFKMGTPPACPPPYSVSAAGLQRAQRSSLSPPRARSESAGPSTSNDDDDELAIEKQMAKRRSKTKAAPSPPGPYKVISATRDQVYGDGPKTELQEFENNVITFLTFLFCVIIVEGVFLAASGFLSEHADQFGQDVVYPAFSPTIALFLACSSAYGLWKTGGGRKEE